MKAILYIITTLELTYIAIYNWRFLIKLGNRTGIQFKNHTYLSLVLAVALICLRALKKSHSFTLTPIILALLIVINIFLFNYFNICVEYMEWFDRGTPSKPFELK